MPAKNDNAGSCEFEFPECWKNDIRMGALFAPFRSKAINPTDWNSKMKFWTSLIESWCKYSKCPVLNISSLKEDFSRKGVTPACLDEVIQNLSSTGVIVFKEYFISNPADTWKGWAVKVFVTDPVKWTFNTVKNALIGKNDLSESEYIHIPVIKFLGEDLIKQIPSSSRGKLLTFDKLIELGWPKGKREHLLLILQWLNKEGLVSICDKNEEMLVKFAKNGVKPVKITETDWGIKNLEEQQKVLENNIRIQEEKRNTALEEAKKHMASKMKNLAIMSLKKKKEIEKTIEMRVTTLENIQALLQKIDQAKLDSEIVESYQTGIKTLKMIFNETGLNEKNVSSTMEELEDVLNNCNNVDQYLSKPLDPVVDKDLEDELEELLLENLPDVPVEKISPTNTDDKKSKSKEKKTEELNTKMEALSL